MREDFSRTIIKDLVPDGTNQVLISVSRNMEDKKLHDGEVEWLGVDLIQLGMQGRHEPSGST